MLLLPSIVEYGSGAAERLVGCSQCLSKARSDVGVGLREFEVPCIYLLNMGVWIFRCRSGRRR